jgi:hypothetical protein
MHGGNMNSKDSKELKGLLSDLAEKISYMQSKVNSGRHTGADVQNLKDLMSRYEEAERKLLNASLTMLLAG